MVNPKSSQPVSAERRLLDLGIVLPDPPHPLGAYVEAVQSGSLLFLSGMLPIKDGKPQYAGRLGKELDAGAGRDALRTATLNALSAAKAHVGSLDCVTMVVSVKSTWQRLKTSTATPSSLTLRQSFFAMYLESTGCPCGLSSERPVCHSACRSC